MRVLNATFKNINHKAIAIAALWVFHIAACIGVTLGFKDWFISKTPFTLSLMLIMLIVYFPIKKFKKWVFAFIVFCLGFLVEWIGVKYGIPFGKYHYGENLGVKLDGIPLMIGVNWTVLVLITGVISAKLTSKIWLRILSASLLMVFLDFFMEKSAPIFDFWIWDIGHAPLQNYVAWFGIALIMQFLFQSFKIAGDLKTSLNVYAAQLMFFVYFFGLHSF